MIDNSGAEEFMWQFPVGRLRNRSEDPVGARRDIGVTLG
jgi:hypothetical protein